MSFKQRNLSPDINFGKLGGISLHGIAAARARLGSVAWAGEPCCEPIPGDPRGPLAPPPALARRSGIASQWICCILRRSDVNQGTVAWHGNDAPVKVAEDAAGKQVPLAHRLCAPSD